MSSSSTWKDAYAADKNQLFIIHHLLYHRPFEKVTLSSLSAQYRRAVANNTLGIVEGSLIFYKIVPTTANTSVVL